MEELRKRSLKEVDYILNQITCNQVINEQHYSKEFRKKKGVYFTNSHNILDNLLNVIRIDYSIFNKRILEPSCGEGIFIIKILTNIYIKYPDKNLITHFLSENLFFVDISEEMIEMTKNNIKRLFLFMFDEEYEGDLNGIVWDFTDKNNIQTNLFDVTKNTPFDKLYSSFDYVIGNPPYVTLYGRRDKKESEEQRIKYLQNYKQFPSSLKNGKLNFVMLFIEHSICLLKDGGELSFIIDVSFFETAYQHTRKFLLENTIIKELQVNIKEFQVGSGQVILKVQKSINNGNNQVNIIDYKTKKEYTVNQSFWNNKNDEYKFRYNGCQLFKQIIDKVAYKRDKMIVELFPEKNLRTSTMLLDMEEKFTVLKSDSYRERNELLYPYYRGSKGLSQKYGKLNFEKYFIYNKQLQDNINNELKVQLEKQGIKNKKRVGLGEISVFNNPKVFIRQSAKEIIATIDIEKSAANNSLYIFTLRDNSQKSIDFLYFLCGFLNSDFITYYAQKMNIIRYSLGKQPQIKISDLGTIFLPIEEQFQRKIGELCKSIYQDFNSKDDYIFKINEHIYNYYGLTLNEIDTIKSSIKDF